MDNSTLQAALAEYFAPWVQALGLVVAAMCLGISIIVAAAIH